MIGKTMTPLIQNRTGKLEQLEWHLNEIKFYKSYLQKTKSPEIVWRIIELDYQAVKKLKNELLCQN